MPPDKIDAQICYLLTTPCDTPVPLNAPESIRPLKDAPYFTPIDIVIRALDSETIELENVAVTIRRQVYDGLTQVAECFYALPDVLSRDAFHLKARIQTALRAHLHGAGEISEEYTALLVTQFDGTPAEFIERNGQSLARFLRSQRERFDPQEISDVVMSRARYSESELTVVDWDGAIVISPDGDFQSDIELFKIGNYQLLRYRLLDQAIERNLRTVNDRLLTGARSLLPNRSRRIMRESIEQRLAIMLEFEKIDQNLLLIGDWYTAKLYQIIYDEFYLDEWKSAIQSKLGNLESINQLIQDNLTFSWSSFLEFMQIVGWLILLVGYFVLFFLEASKGR
ncbi:MAG TPA: hypothetical protein VFF70_05485 [Anaerolineae bacterium]|nr:hypothetical protein [Anaerolineae bacterium]